MLAMIRPHARPPDTAERQLVVGQVHHAVIDAQATRCGTPGDGFDNSLVIRIAIAGQWFTSGQITDEINHVINSFVARAGEQGPEDLVFHDGSLFEISRSLPKSKIVGSIYFSLASVLPP